jgi:hypothetical protein
MKLRAQEVSCFQPSPAHPEFVEGFLNLAIKRESFDKLRMNGKPNQDARIRSTLIVGEGMSHCYIYQSNLPEARDAYQVIVDFFRENLQ